MTHPFAAQLDIAPKAPLRISQPSCNNNNLLIFVAQEQNYTAQTIKQ
jgi:hypothetical protein